MNIAIIGTGNVGGALANKWAHKGHQIFLGVKDPLHFKGKDLLKNPNTHLESIQGAVAKAEIILMAIPATAVTEVIQELGDTSGKIIIDAMNIVRGRGPLGYKTTTEAILNNTATRDVVKCFNTTGYNNMENTMYGDVALDLFVAGDSIKGKEAAIRLAEDAGFETCYDAGGNDQFELMEQFAGFWINLAMFRGLGREIGFKLLKR